MSLLNLTMPPIAAYGYPLGVSALYQANSTLGSRLVRRDDGQIILREKSVAEILGEQVLRPLLDRTIDLSCKSVRLLKKGWSFFDRVTTKMVNIFPVALAAEVPNNNQAVIVFKDGQNGLDFRGFIGTVRPADGPIIHQDLKFQELFTRAGAMKEDIDKFIRTTSYELMKFEADLIKFSQSYASLYEKIDKIYVDLKLNRRNSAYSPFRSGKLSLVFPECEVRLAANAVGFHPITIKGELAFDGKDLLTNFPKIRESQSRNYIEKSITLGFYRNTPLSLKLFYLNFDQIPHTVQEFKALFTEETLDYAAKIIRERKAAVKSWLESEQTFKEELLVSNNGETHDRIERTIDDIYSLQKTMIENENNKGNGEYRMIDEIKTKHGLVSSWKVVHRTKGFFGGVTEETCFEFYLGSMPGDWESASDSSDEL
jgi:hypothetical protein